MHVCVCVIAIQHANCISSVLHNIVFCGLFGYTIFFHVINGMIFRGKEILNVKDILCFSLQLFF